jgi:hypothetical protein
MEWSAAKGRWIELPPGSSLEDRCLRQPIQIAAANSDQLELWSRRVLSARSLDEVFAAEPDSA